MNRKSTFLVILLCGLLCLALVLRNGGLLLLTVPFLSYFVFGVWKAPDAVQLHAVRTIDKSSVNAGDPVESRISIQNRGAGPLNLSLEDRLFPSMLIISGQSSQRIRLEAGETTELRYQFTANRGVYTWRNIHVCASDPLGLFDLKAEVSAPGEVLVRPAPISFRPLRLKPRRTLPAAGPIPARLAGSGTDFWGVRTYRTGDSLRRLNWRLSARRPGKIFTNEYEREEIADYGLVLDARELTGAGEAGSDFFEYAVGAAAAFAEMFLKNGNRVSLLIYTKPIRSLFPGYGKVQLQRLQRSLARVKPGAYLPLNYLEYFPTRLFPSRSMIVVFSPVFPRDLEVYARLRAYGYDVLLISPDPVSYSARLLPVTDRSKFALRAARVERVTLLKRLLKMGVSVVDWQVEQPLDTLLNSSIRRGNRDLSREVLR